MRWSNENFLWRTSRFDWVIGLALSRYISQQGPGQDHQQMYTYDTMLPKLPGYGAQLTSA